MFFLAWFGSNTHLLRLLPLGWRLVMGGNEIQKQHVTKKWEKAQSGWRLFVCLFFGGKEILKKNVTNCNAHTLKRRA